MFTHKLFRNGALLTSIFQLAKLTVCESGEAISPPSKPSAYSHLAGINFAGLDFGATNDGQYQPNAAFPPMSQIHHFTQQGVNLFRVPVAWPFLQPELNAPLNQTSAKAYVDIIKNITAQGAFAVIDIHSYARFKGNIVGESANTPANALADLWKRLTELFKDNPKVLYGLSNEPHDVVIASWAKTVQEAVTAIRKAGGQNPILIPGNEYTSLQSFPKWYDTMKSVKNPDGSFDGLIFEVHRYLDGDNSGTSKECVASHVEDVKTAVALLQKDNRQAFLGETGGGSTDSCVKLLPEFVGAITEASNSFIGWAMWAAGAFKPDYPLVLTVADASEPTGWKDQPNWISVKNLLPKAGSTKAPGTTTPPSKPSHKSSKGAKRAIGDGSGCQTRKRLRRMMMKT